jgi:hypothetical protein
MMGNRLPADIGVAVAALLRWSLEISGGENSVSLGVLPEYRDSDEDSEPTGYRGYASLGYDFNWAHEAQSGIELTIEEAIYQALVALGERVKG